MTSLNLWNPNYAGFSGGSRARAVSDIAADPLTENRDVRIDLLCGLANWSIFLDHSPHNVANLITLRNFGFSGAADLFLFVSGYAVAVVYARMIAERGLIVGATRIFKRVWQLYAAYIVLFAVYIVAIGHVAVSYAYPDILSEFNVSSLIDHPVRTLAHGLMLQTRVLNLDMLPLYIVLTALFPPVLWGLMKMPGLTLAGSFALYLAARQFGWNLPSFPDGSWYYNPFCWQLYFVFGAWLALGGTRQVRAVFDWPLLPYVGAACLVFAFVMTSAGRYPPLGDMFPDWLLDTFIPVDKINLGPYRLLHFIIVAFMVTRFVPKEWRVLQWPVFQPIIKCGQQSLAIFCLGVFLSFAGHLVLITSPDSVLMQVLVSVAGISIMIVVAYAIAWSKEQDRPVSKPAH
jgi:hypothetical protein